MRKTHFLSSFFVGLSFLLLCATANDAIAAIGVREKFKMEERQAREEMQKEMLQKSEDIGKTTQIDKRRQDAQQQDQQFFPTIDGISSNQSAATDTAMQMAQQMEQQAEQRVQQRGGYGQRGQNKRNGPWVADNGMGVVASNSCNVIVSNQVMPIPASSIQNNGKMLASPIVSATLIAGAAAGGAGPCPEGGNGVIRCENKHYKPEDGEEGADSEASPTQKGVQCKSPTQCAQ
jgi:glucan-binding YG repeat protein